MSNVIQRSLAGGELTPALWPRTDTSKYATGVRTMRNMMVMRTGGATSRPGTVVDSAVKDSSKKVRMFEFVFNLSQTYLLEFGDGYIRFHQNGSQVLVSGVLAWSNSTAYVIGDLVSKSGVNYYCILGNTNHTPANATYWYPLTGAIYEIPSPFAVADLPLIRYSQSGDVITLTHSSYPPQELQRHGQTDWIIAPAVIGVEMDFPKNVTTTTGGSGTTYYFITAVNQYTKEESVDQSPYYSATGGFATSFANTSATPSSGAPVTIEWDALDNAGYYNIYKQISGSIYAFIGTTSDTTFQDTGITPDPSNPAPLSSNNPFATTDEYPTCCAYYQQRMLYGNTNNNPTRVTGSVTGVYHDFNTHTPVIESDSLSFAMSGTRDSIQHMLSLGILIVFTAGSETSINGDQSGALSPEAINPRQESVHGCSTIRPLVVGEFALYVQARGTIVRDLGFNFQVDGYRGDDLTIFATHLFDGHTIVDWAYQCIPNSIVWAVRDDGVLLALTYIREQQILGWHRHDMDGIVENVCVVPEGSEDAVYFVVNRTINGSSTRFIERLSSTIFNDVRDYVGMDCANSFDGRNAGATTMTISGGTNWDETETLTMTASTSFFASTDATNGNQIIFTDSDENVIFRFTVMTYSSGTVVTGFADRTVPVANQSVATASWSKAVSHLSGLSYLEGQNVSVFGDGFVVGSPNNAAYPVYTVSSGAIVLDKPYVVIHVGLPITADLETLDIDTPSPAESLSDKLKLVQQVTLHLVNSRGAWIGGANPDDDLDNPSDDPLLNMVELKLRQYEGYDQPVELVTGKVTQNIPSEWNSNGHVFIRQVDPLPLTVAAISPDGDFPFRGAS